MSPGYHVMPAEKYHADPCVVPSLNNGVAQILLRQSALSAWYAHPKLNPEYREKQDEKFDLGRHAHAVVLEGTEERLAVVEANDWRTKAAQEAREAARSAGKVPLLARHVEAVRRMAAAAQAFIKESEIADYWDDAESELVGISMEDGVHLRCRFDRIARNRRIILDYKTTEDVSPETFSRQITRMGYHFQEAFYRRIARNLGAVGPRFFFLAQSVEPPHECSLHGCHESLQEVADAEVEQAIHLWRVHTKSKQWPSYGGRVHYAIPTTWQLQQHEMRLAA